MRKVFSLLLGILFLVGCKTPRLVTQQNFTTELGRVLPYEEVAPKKEKEQHLALLLPDNPDTLNLAESGLSRMLVKNGYRIIIPGKPGTDTREKIELDNKSYRIRDINNLLSSIDTSSIEDFIIIGIGEGGYLVPDISFSIPSKAAFVINAGPASPLAEYQNLVYGKIQDYTFLNSVLSANLLFNKGELAEQIARITENPFGEPQLVGGSNAYWISYYEDPLMNRIIKPDGLTYWMISENYPLISDENKKLAMQVCDRLPYLFYEELEGRGNFNDEDEMKLLMERIEEVINSQLQSYVY